MKLISLLIAILLTSCGASEKPTAISGTEPDMLHVSLERYRTLCRSVHSSRCDAPVDIEFTGNGHGIQVGLSGLCVRDVERERPLVIISKDAKALSALELDLLVAHEAEHCIRGVEHVDEGQPHLMNAVLSTKKEAYSRTYEEWVLESLEINN